MSESLLQQARLAYQPKLPSLLQEFSSLQAIEGEPSSSFGDGVKELFPLTFGQPEVTFSQSEQEREALRVGVVLSGGQAPGGHNVISGLFDALKKNSADSLLIGFLNGPSGITDDQTVEITEEFLAPFRNQGGFDIIGSGRTKIETPKQFEASLATVQRHDLDALVVIGGDDSNTNAALLAEYFKKQGCKTTVIGVPKTIDGDLKSDEIEISFGCDTACKTFSEIIGNILRDCRSAKKYYYFVKLMGRSASHIALECALQTHPNWTFIGEEVAEKGWTLKQLTDQLVDLIVKRSSAGKDFGVVLIPEGIIEFIPEFRKMIDELNSALAENSPEEAVNKLSDPSANCFNGLPELIQKQLLLDRDPHGNVQVSKIETERLFIETVRDELKKRSDYQGKFAAQPHFCGYEGRSCLPSNFDSDYCYALGHVAALLATCRLTGYMSCVGNLTAPVEEWTISGLPITSLMHTEIRHGKPKPVIAKALTELEGRPFEYFKEQRDAWAMDDDYVCPGPIQFFGPAEITDAPLITLSLERQSKTTCSAG